MDSHTHSAEELYALYHQDIVRFFAEHLADREAAWDLCHEVFVRLLITLASGTSLHAPQRWLLRVAKNLLTDTYRHHTQRLRCRFRGSHRNWRCSPAMP